MLGWIKCFALIFGTCYILHWALKPDPKPKRPDPALYHARLAGRIYRSSPVYNTGLVRR